jgi:hypothetical protein
MKVKRGFTMRKVYDDEEVLDKAKLVELRSDHDTVNHIRRAVFVARDKVEQADMIAEILEQRFPK